MRWRTTGCAIHGHEILFLDAGRNTNEACTSSGGSSGASKSTLFDSILHPPARVAPNFGSFGRRVF
jgi:hypothetical protein